MLSKKILKENHEICLLLVDKFLEICKKNNITYYVTEGSALGVMRHKGFIPWDINFDVHLDVAEFYKLDAAMKKEDLGDLVWKRPAQRICALMMHKNSENLPTCPNIDVTIMGNIPNNKIGRMAIVNIAFFNIKMFKLKNTDVKRKFPYNFLKIFCSFIPDTFYFGVLRRLEKINQTRIKQFKSAYTPSFFGKTELIKTDWIGKEPVYGDFEGRKVRIFEKCEAYLNHRYGDWKTPKVWESKGEYDGCFIDR